MATPVQIAKRKTLHSSTLVQPEERYKKSGNIKNYLSSEKKLFDIPIIDGEPNLIHRKNKN
jgi:hypothetical protein